MTSPRAAGIGATGYGTTGADDAEVIVPCRTFFASASAVCHAGARPVFAAHVRGRRFPVAEAAGRRNLALPIWPHLSDAEVERVADAVVEFFR